MDEMIAFVEIPFLLRARQVAAEEADQQQRELHEWLAEIRAEESSFPLVEDGEVTEGVPATLPVEEKDVVDMEERDSDARCKKLNQEIDELDAWLRALGLQGEVDAPTLAVEEEPVSAALSVEVGPFADYLPVKEKVVATTVTVAMEEEEEEEEENENEEETADLPCEVDESAAESVAERGEEAIDREKVAALLCAVLIAAAATSRVMLKTELVTILHQLERQESEDWDEYMGWLRALLVVYEGDGNREDDEDDRSESVDDEGSDGRDGSNYEEDTDDEESFEGDDEEGDDEESSDGSSDESSEGEEQDEAEEEASEEDDALQDTPESEEESAPATDTLPGHEADQGKEEAPEDEARCQLQMPLLPTGLDDEWSGDDLSGYERLERYPTRHTKGTYPPWTGWNPGWNRPFGGAIFSIPVDPAPSGSLYSHISSWEY
jgi:hypothetical protein